MNNIIIKLLALNLLMLSSLGAQEKLTKVFQSIRVDKDVTIDLKSSYCNIVFDTWNKNEVEIEAYIESEELSKEKLQDALKRWDLDIDGAQDLITINGNKNHNSNDWVPEIQDDNEIYNVLEELKYQLADIPNILFDIPEIPQVPALPHLPELPPLPPMPERTNALRFDYEAYKKDGEKYLEKWSEDFESTYGEDYAEKMEKWGETFGEAWGEKFGKAMEKWGEKFGEAWEGKYEDKMEAWGDRYAEKMEKRAEQLEKKHEAMAKLKEQKQNRKQELDERIGGKEKHRHSNIKKTIIIKMPKKAKLKINVKHGALEFAANVDDVQADLLYTKFKAQDINGSTTSINASYAPFYVSNWNLGELSLNHVRQAELDQVKHIVLNTNSSNIKIKNVISSAIIDGNIGDIDILKVDDTFSNLNFILQNNKMVIVLPDINYNLNYKGKNSSFSHPKNNKNNASSSFSISHPESNKTIIVNAKYSNLVMK